MTLPKHLLSHPAPRVHATGLYYNFAISSSPYVFISTNSYKSTYMGSKMPPNLDNLYYAQVTCRGFGELPERIRDADISHGAFPTPCPSSTSIQGLLSRSESGYQDK